MKSTVSSRFMTVPAPCGLAVTSVTGDGEYLYALQPDRKTVYKLDVCGRILCTFKIARRYLSLHYCGNRRFYATAEREGRRIYVLSNCFREIGAIEPPFDDRTENGASCRRAAPQLFVGGAGDCGDNDCMLTAATRNDCYAVTPNGRIVERLSSAGRERTYTAVCENNGILYEALESRTTALSCVRATLLANGENKVKHLPYGYRVRSFFCHGGYLYVYFTKNGYHGYIAAVCTFASNGTLAGDLFDLPDDGGCDGEDCRWESCRGFSDSCGSGSYGVTSLQTDLCDNAVGGDSTETGNGNGSDCDSEELCRLYRCLKKMCRPNRPPMTGGGCGGSCGGNGSCGGSCGNRPYPPFGNDFDNDFEVDYDGGCCENGTLSCSRYPRCRCNENDVSGDSESCLPLPCPDVFPCPPARHTTAATENAVPCSTDGLKVSYDCGK